MYVSMYVKLCLKLGDSKVKYLNAGLGQNKVTKQAHRKQVK